MSKIEFDYYYGAEADQFSFVRIPRVLFTDKEKFGTLSNEAKLLYGLLLERMELSKKITGLTRKIVCISSSR